MSGNPLGVPALPEDAGDLAELYAMNPETLRANMVMSLDGAAAVDGRVRALSCPTDLRLLLLLRALADVVLVGAGTVRAENYGPVRLDADLAAVRAKVGLGVAPPLAVVSGSLNLDPTARLFSPDGPPPLVLTSQAAADARGAALRGVADLVVVGTDRVDATRIRPALADRGLTRVLCEGGPTLLGELAAVDALDELCLTLSPRYCIGADPHVPGLRSQIVGLRLRHARSSEEFLYLRYERH